MTRGLIIAAPSSGSGKTTITLGILRALANRGVDVRGAKSGPDYIDPRFHEAACGKTCMNLDAWAMTPDRIKTLASGDGMLIIEGAMGLFDGALPAGKGATADLARILNIPVILVVDAAKMAQSIAPLVSGFATHDPNVTVAGVILNNVGSPRHELMLRDALIPLSIPVFGAIYRNPDLNHPSRHLGLVQASERADLDAYLDQVAEVVDKSVDLDAIQAIPTNLPATKTHQRNRAPAQRIAIASDKAFAFAYPHILQDWRAAGAELSFFSPLADEAPEQVDMIVLPGGYPELYAGQLATNTTFINHITKASQDTVIYGECGGYMMLGNTLTDADGVSHKMLGLLDLETSFAKRKLHLGYRQLSATAGPFVGNHNAHEFHYATTIHAQGTPLFQAKDAAGTTLDDMGLINGNVCGSFAHLIDSAD